MSRDPDAEGVADEALAFALKSFDPSRGVPVEAWVAKVVKQNVWCWWRRIAVRPRFAQEPEEFDLLGQLSEPPPHPTELLCGVYDWVLLWEHHVEKFPLDGLARSRGVSVAQLKRMIQQAEDRLIIANLLAEAE